MIQIQTILENVYISLIIQFCANNRHVSTPATQDGQNVNSTQLITSDVSSTTAHDSILIASLKAELTTPAPGPSASSDQAAMAMGSLILSIPRQHQKKLLSE